MTSSYSSSAPGYYHIKIHALWPGRCLRSNTERAYVLGCLQDTFGWRASSHDSYSQSFAPLADLLAFSITGQSVELIVFVVHSSVATKCGRYLSTKIKDFQSERPAVSRLFRDLTTTTRFLVGPHEALWASVTLHHQHDDWEYDRYSSIGFYLHDRRGEWMRPWRLCRLYHQQSALYRQLMTSRLPNGTDEKQSFTLNPATS